MSTVLVTGAGRGIGRAITEEFIRRGHRVIGTARDPRSLQDLDLDQRLALDVTDDASVAAAFAAAGDVDIVVVNPAEIFYAAVEAIPLPELLRLFDLNTVGAIRVAQAALPQMRARGDGKLLFMSSVVGRIVLPLGVGLRGDQVGAGSAGGISRDRGCPVRRPGRAARAGGGEFRRARQRDLLHAGRRPLRRPRGRR